MRAFFAWLSFVAALWGWLMAGILYLHSLHAEPSIGAHPERVLYVILAGMLGTCGLMALALFDTPTSGRAPLGRATPMGTAHSPLNVIDNRKPCPHCGDPMNKDPEHSWHCNTLGCAGFKPEAWPEGSIGRAALHATPSPEATHDR